LGKELSQNLQIFYGVYAKNTAKKLDGNLF